jgi:hypothetical protein
MNKSHLFPVTHTTLVPSVLDFTAFLVCVWGQWGLGEPFSSVVPRVPVAATRAVPPR